LHLCERLHKDRKKAEGHQNQNVGIELPSGGMKPCGSTSHFKS
jgi:hypothetical protein